MGGRPQDRGSADAQGLASDGLLGLPRQVAAGVDGHCRQQARDHHEDEQAGELPGLGAIEGLNPASGAADDDRQAEPDGLVPMLELVSLAP